MKNTLLLIIITLALTGCEMFMAPEANFEVSKTTVIPYEEIQFKNYSKHASEYDWDFGDGYHSSEAEPIYYYTEPGTYEVKLSAYKNDQVSEAYLTIQVLAADLNIEVREYKTNYIVPGAKVILYPTLNDWDNQEHKVATATTDTKGIVEFYNLADGFYYMDISNSNHDNYQLAASDIGFIKTPYIGGSTTYITAYVDYVSTPSSAAVKRTMIPVALKRTYNPEMSKRAIK
jgi:PKD repeat protein